MNAKYQGGLKRVRPVGMESDVPTSLADHPVQVAFASDGRGGVGFGMKKH